jgi:Flp pilus assembly protein CpaB
MGAERGGGPPARSVPVVVAAHDLPAGHRLTGADLSIAQWPAALRPSGAQADPVRVAGQRLAGAIRAREAVTTARVLGRGLTAGLSDGSVAAAVTLEDPHVADLVRAGDRVDLLEAPRPPDVVDSAPPTDPKVSTLASHALVLAVLPRTDDADAEVVLAVDRATAVRITRDRGGQLFTVVVDPP